jgi:hypothetical protein
MAGRRVKMKRAIIYTIITLATISTTHAKGAAETKPAPVNDTWTLCVTMFDTSELPQGRAVIGNMVMQYIIENIRAIDARLWTSREAAYYNNAAQLRAKSAAAKALRDKQAERDKLIFAGENERKYKQNLKRVDTELDTLRLNLKKAEAIPISIAVSPTVKLVAENYDKTYPAPPPFGQEYYFCAAQKSDAFLAGKITEYFGRIYVEISLWSIYARKITYTDSIIFSPEDIKEGATELSDKLFDYISGFLPAWIKVKTDPDTAVIVVGDYVVGDGETEAMDFTPGTISVTAFANDYVTFQKDIELREGEQTDVSIELTPIPVVEFDVTLKDEQQPTPAADEPAPADNKTAAVYDGSLYAGSPPLKLTGPLNQKRNLSIETPDGRVAQTVFHVSADPIVFDPAPPPPQDRTSAARKKFYAAYGRFWIALPLAMLGMGLNNTITSVYNATGDPNMGQQRTIVYWTSIGLNVLMGAFLAETFYRIGRYVWEASKESSLLLKKEPEKETAAEEQAGVSAGAPAGFPAETPAGLTDEETSGTPAALSNDAANNDAPSIDGQNNDN